MSIYQRLRANLRNDPLLQRVVRNSSYLFSSSAVSAVLSAVQMIFVVRLLDPDGYGLATGIIMVFASNVNRFLSFGMSEVIWTWLLSSAKQQPIPTRKPPIQPF